MRDLLRQNIVDSLAAMPPEMTLRDVHVPAVRGKAVAVIGPRRAGKTTFLWQVVAERLAVGRSSLVACGIANGSSCTFPVPRRDC